MIETLWEGPWWWKVGLVALALLVTLVLIGTWAKQVEEGRDRRMRRELDDAMREFLRERRGGTRDHDEAGDDGV